MTIARKKYSKPYRSWMGRAEALATFLRDHGFQVEYTADSAEIIKFEHSWLPSQATPKKTPKKSWWRWW